MSDDRHEAVSRRAYELWEKEGGVHGRHEDHWHQANSEMDGEAAGEVAAPDGTTLTPAPAAKRAPAKPRAKAAEKPQSDEAGTAAAAAKPRKPKTPK